MIRIAVTKGRVENDVYKLMKKAGFDVLPMENKDRELFIKTKDDIEMIFVKAYDLLTFIEQGIVDVGIVGKDTLEESNFLDYNELLDLNIGKCYFAFASYNGYEKKDLKRRRKIATKYPNIAKKYFRSLGEDIEIIKLNGSIEIAPIVGMTDGIVDIVETGNTLRANGLKILDKICDVSTRLITNKVSLKYKSDEIYKIIDSFEKVIGG